MAPVGFHFSLPAAEGGIPYIPAVVTQPACPTPRAQDEPSRPEPCWLPLMDGPFDSPPSAILDEASEQASKERAKGERKAAKEEKKGEQRAAKAEAKQLRAQEKAAKKEEKRVAREMADTAKTVKSLQKEQDRLAKRAGVAENKGDKASKQRRALDLDGAPSPATSSPSQPPVGVAEKRMHGEKRAWAKGCGLCCAQCLLMSLASTGVSYSQSRTTGQGWGYGGRSRTTGYTVGLGGRC